MSTAQIKRKRQNRSNKNTISAQLSYQQLEKLNMLPHRDENAIEALRGELIKRGDDLHSRTMRKLTSEIVDVKMSMDTLYSKGIKQQLSNMQSEYSRVVKLVSILEKELSKKDRQFKELTSTVKGLSTRCVKVVEVRNTSTQKTIDVGVAHKQFVTLLSMLKCDDIHVYLTGPAGSGKTTAAEQCAKALGLPFYFTGAISSEFKLSGFINAQGKIVSTEFRKAYEEGGLFLFDEIDASYPQAVLAFNAALANGQMDFPDRTVKRHKDFCCIAAANTYGTGADREYVGRQQLDAASLDRFVFLDWGYDEELEMNLCTNKEWLSFVQDVRRVITQKRIRHVVSPRASIKGASLLKGGLTKAEVMQCTIWKGLDESTIEMIKENLSKVY